MFRCSAGPWPSAANATWVVRLKRMTGEGATDRSNRRARWKLSGQIVANADRLPELARQAIVDAAELPGQLLLQDVKRGPDSNGLGDKDDDGDADTDVSLKNRGG